MHTFICDLLMKQNILLNCPRGGFKNRKKNRQSEAIEVKEQAVEEKALPRGHQRTGRHLAAEKNAQDQEPAEKALPRGLRRQGRHLAVEKSMQYREPEEKALARGQQRGGRHLAADKSIHEQEPEEKAPPRGHKRQGRHLAAEERKDAEEEDIAIMENISLERINLGAAGITIFSLNIKKACLNFKQRVSHDFQWLKGTVARDF